MGKELNRRKKEEKGRKKAEKHTQFRRKQSRGVHQHTFSFVQYYFSLRGRIQADLCNLPKSDSKLFAKELFNEYLHILISRIGKPQHIV